eukprot:NODE_4845_length_1839_cov_11.189836.p1 GENE.NODE_4845_length_1839_cov_11.189836~~NODE_4845_length_1839_cov_11.189836.p1  ORF type:complete len:432 (-),score=103.77 NODE_4845_length_1839_cov_11.189836:414-1709(-)
MTTMLLRRLFLVLGTVLLASAEEECSSCSAAAVVSGAAAPAAVAATASEPADHALFTHARGELHCMDRELRHLCVPELRRFVDEGEVARQEAYSCVEQVFMSHKDDYWMLKNMTHLLLDLDGNVHVFDRRDRGDDFIDLGMRFARRLMKHEDCLAEFDLKDPFECRCVPLYGKILLLKLKVAGRWDEARELFRELTSLTWSGNERAFGPGEAIAWQSFNQTPQIWLPKLRAMPVWPRSTWDMLPIASFLEEHYLTIRREVEASLVKDSWDPTYRFLFDHGDWSQILLYHGREFQPACDALPETCALMRQQLPSKPGVPWVSNQNEQVLFLRMKPGTNVERHSGPANSILNVHLGIKGLEGATLTVDGQPYAWQEGKVIPWDGSFDHTVDCLHCKEDRVILMVRYMHPDVTKESYIGHTRTYFEEIDQSIFM